MRCLTNLVYLQESRYQQRKTSRKMNKNTAEHRSFHGCQTRPSTRQMLRSYSACNVVTSSWCRVQRVITVRAAHSATATQKYRRRLGETSDIELLPDRKKTNSSINEYGRSSRSVAHWISLNEVIWMLGISFEAFRLLLHAFLDFQDGRRFRLILKSEEQTTAAQERGVTRRLSVSVV